MIGLSWHFYLNRLSHNTAPPTWALAPEVVQSLPLTSVCWTADTLALYF
jgi:hypothetical protein